MPYYELDSNNVVISKSGLDVDGWQLIVAEGWPGDVYLPATQTFDSTRSIILQQVAAIDSQIADIEAAQTRQLREIALGLDDGTARDKLAASDVQIATLREQRTALEAQL